MVGNFWLAVVTAGMNILHQETTRNLLTLCATLSFTSMIVLQEVSYNQSHFLPSTIFIVFFFIFC